METKERAASVAGVLGRRFAGALKPPLLDMVQAGALKMTYRGAQLVKNPFDLALYTLLIERLRPRTVIEIGTWQGGSALWFADVLAAHQIPEPRVITVDVDGGPRVVNDDRIDFLIGNARALDEVLDPGTMAVLPRPLLAIDDGSHLIDDCLAALEFFHRYLRPAEYVVVEDGNLSQFSHPIYETLEDGPNRALAAFLDAHPREYEIDAELCDHFGYNVTGNPNGWLRRTQ